MTYNVMNLAAAIKDAVKAAQAFASQEDGGACNMDSVFIQAEGISEAEAEEIGRISGVRVYIFDSKVYGRILMLSGIADGQGFRRTKMAEAAKKSLEEKGLLSGVWYQMD